MIVIGGPTAVGKSEVACLLAKEIDGQIISADSMSVYKKMDIGTAKPLECMKEVKHYLIDVVMPGEYFDAKLFEKLATQAIENIKSEGKVPIVCGGTYLYIQALLYGIDDTPEPDFKLRERLYSIAQKKGKHHLYKKLCIVDPVYCKKIHPNDLRRVVRALEVFLQTGKPFSSFHRWSKPRYDFVGFYLKRSWNSLSKRIEERVYRMIESGLLQEVEALLKEGFENFLTSSQAIGYKELIPYLKGNISLEEAIRRIIDNTKEQAKRQIRWFRSQGWHEIDLDALDTKQVVTKIIQIYTSRRHNY
ncbi:tRNA (adenosine(37)-N6)-dimethylallyltransferase MiaA [Thermocrinis minervae]|uniref:tRNA dimethylallyltransferase n=1 Tax=Thermocrinis minervae TaxID=381751 RepID=A0A1M6TM51_9AQUI|nr:tRNA (adenosine(37)-N6)-dimethylallyltransferase MiaA [Thermocrinis minervae]SHK57986.1 tRNA dimethylallyltransferase [Thermocrinis minervae]